MRYNKIMRDTRKNHSFRRGFIKMIALFKERVKG